MSAKSSKILVPIGFSEQSIIALDQACCFAKLDSSKFGKILQITTFTNQGQ